MEKYGTAGQATDDRQYGAVALRAGYLRLQTHIQNILPQQQWLRERASVLRYTFIACLVPPQLGHGNVCSLLIRVLVLCHESSRRNCSHLTFVFGFVAIKILLRRWKNTNSSDVMSHVSLLSDHCYVIIFRCIIPVVL